MHLPRTSAVFKSAVIGALSVLLIAACSGDDDGRGASTTTRAEAGPTPTDTTARSDDPLVVTPAIALEFLGSVVRDQDDGGRHIVRWPADASIRIAVAGTATDDDVRVLDEAMVAYASRVPLTLSRSADDPDIVMHFVPKDQWAGLVDDPGIDLGPAGWTYTLSQGTDERPDTAGELTDAIVVIDSALPQAARNRVIAHELGHALGLGHTACLASLMNQSSEARPLWSPAPLDLELVEILYDDRIEPGMSAPEIEQALDPTGVQGAVCGQVQWRLVEFDDRTYFCGAADGVQPCVLYDGSEPTAPVTNPDGWITEGQFADYDPRLWIEYGFEGLRLLCDRSDVQYRPCAVFDGISQPSTPIVDPAFWTDGAVVYDTFPG